MPTRLYRRLLFLAAAVEAALLGLHELGQGPPPHVVEFITAYLAASLFYLVSCYLIMAAGAVEPGRGMMRLIWGAAIVFRLTALPLDPQLSEDPYRYRWNGKLQVAGGNPYTEAPESTAWNHLRDETYPLVPGKHLPTTYGPLLEAIFAGTYRVAAVVTNDPFRQAWLFKIPFALIELAVGLALATLLRAMGRPPTWLLIYLWSPLIVVEFWGQGHNDPPVLLFVVLALAAGVRGRWTRGWGWLTAAALTKLWPLLLAPFFLLRRKGESRRLSAKAALVSAALIVMLSAAYWDGILQLGETLRVFAAGRQNNASLYALILAATGGGYGSATVWAGGILVLTLAGLAFARLEIVRASMAAVAALLLLSANCFPWYLGWLVPFLAIYPNAALLLWTALAALAYHVVIDYAALGVWRESTAFRLLEYLPVYLMLLGGSLAVRSRTLGVLGPRGRLPSGFARRRRR